MRRSAAILGILVLALGMPGCSDDDPIPVPQFGPAQINTIAGGTVGTLITVQEIASLILFADDGTDGLGECEDISLDLCDGGGFAEYCPDDSVNLDACVVDGVGSLTGTVAFDGESVISFTNLVVDGTATLNGTISVVPVFDGGECFVFGYALAVTSGGLTQNMAGTLEQCLGDFPSGLLTVIIPEFNVSFAWFFEGTQFALFEVIDLTTKESLAFCQYDLVGETVECK